MTEPAELSKSLDRLAERFEAAVVDHPPASRGWGQFLDPPRDHRQVGPYGTSAGIIVLSLAGRGKGPPLDDALSLMRHWWTGRHQDEYSSRRFAQTTRLAFFLLAMRHSHQATPDEISEIEQLLLDTLLPSNRWGNYSVSSTERDPTPRDFASAVALIAFLLGRDDNSIQAAQLGAVAEHLEERLSVTQSLSSFNTAMLALAVLLGRKGRISRSAKRTIGRLAYTGPVNLARKGIYHYQCQFQSASDPHQKFKNEYFIVPTELVIALAGFQPFAPAGLRLRAENTLQILLENLSANNGAFLTDEEQLASTKYQAWVALLIWAAITNHQKAPAYARSWYALWRRRKDNRLTETVLPVFMILFVGIGSVLLKGQSVLSDALLVGCSTVVGGLYGPSVFRKLVNRL